MKDYPLHFHVEKGEIASPNFQRNLRRLIAHYKRKDGEYTLSIKKRSNKRSNQQNRYYWGVVVPLLMVELYELGNDVDIDITHEFLKNKFLMEKQIRIEIPYNGFISPDVFNKTPSTTKLSTQEFEEYLEKIKQWSAEYLGLVIPDPNEAIKKGIL